ncbi:MAG TPA: translation initiation factor IF-2 [Phycisphaerae bacterium]|nr:translation initiation factor IF-2 [Phycisphaerae bacterium]
MAEKTRVHQLAKELGVSSKAILEKCKAEDVLVKNHMSTLSAGLEATIREWFSEGTHATTVETADRVDLTKVRRKKKATAPTRCKKAAEPDKDEATPTEAPLEKPAAEEPAAPVLAEEAPPVAVEVEAPPAEAAPPPAEAPAPAETELPQRAAAKAPAPEAKPAEPEQAEPEPAESEPVTPVGPQNIPAPAVLQGPRVVRIEQPERFVERRPPRRPAPSVPEIGEAIDPTSGKPSTRQGKARTGRRDVEGPAEGRGRGKPRVHPRRSARASGVGNGVKEWRDQDLIEREERLAAATGGAMRHRRVTQARRAATAPTLAMPGRKGKAIVTEPVTVREFCEATGIGQARVMPKLMEHGVFATVNQTIESDVAELIALDFGVELDIVKPLSATDALMEEYQRIERKNSQTRPPVVTLMGHVDHGKTSLLDRIRRTAVVEGEAGGITQHIGAYVVERGEVRVTFIDTPGHEAFTAMRARGARMTDIVVLVVAAGDGVMPQTIEAINHARAAEVPILVALNKIDLPGLDINRVYSQLSEHNLVPQEWGGDVDVIKTSATTGEGVDQLLEHLHTMAELMELRADATVPALGVVVEASMAAGRGAVATLLIQDGTLREGDVLVAGPASGRLRDLRDDRGRRVKQAGPSVPVAVSGLDVLPEAGDKWYRLDNLKRAKVVAQERRQQLRQESLTATAKPKTLADLVAQQEAGEVPELNVIVRADVQGSVDVIRQQLGDLPSEDVRLRILHVGVGAITEGDVVLAQASSAVVVGFGVVAEDRARQLADNLGVQIRLYQVIYELMEDVRQALEGMLAPEQRIETRGRAEVREIFNISRVGTIAGCMVSDGLVARNFRVRIVRDGRIVRDNAEIGSLKRFKDDAREVRTGFECGIKVAGFDDVKPGDVIEAYEVVEHARSL